MSPVTPARGFLIIPSVRSSTAQPATAESLSKTPTVRGLPKIQLDLSGKPANRSLFEATLPLNKLFCFEYSGPFDSPPLEKALQAPGPVSDTVATMLSDYDQIAETMEIPTFDFGDDDEVTQISTGVPVSVDPAFMTPQPYLVGREGAPIRKPVSADSMIPGKKDK